MINNLIKFSVNNKLIIGIFTLCLIAWGLYSAKRIPLDAIPDITNNQVMVITLTPTLATQEVEQFITTPIEISFSNIPNVEEIRSISRFGISVITVVFEDDVDTYLARQQIIEQLKTVEDQIPKEFGTPEMAPITTGLGEVYQYFLHTTPEFKDKYSITDLRTINDWIVKRQLSGTKGVIEVNTWGGKLKQYEVSITPEKLNSFNLTISDVFNALAENNANTGGGYIEKLHNAYFIRANGLVKSIEDIENISVSKEDNTPIRIKDIGEVRIGYAQRFGAMTWNNNGEVVGGQALMLKGENSYAVVQAVKDKIKKIQQSLPEGVIIEPYIDRSSLIDRAIHTVSTNLIEGGLIVIFVLVLLLGNFRGGLIVASVIPLSLLFALGMMNLFGVSANLMSLGAIDFGLIVDGAVIVVESIIFRLHTKYNNTQLTQKEMNKEVTDSTIKIRSSASFGEIIILIVYLPILALTGIEGKTFAPMAKTVSFAILGALILSLTYVPMVSALFLNKKITNKESLSDKIIKSIENIYTPLLNRVLKHKIIVFLATVIIFISSIISFNRLGGEFIPVLEEGDFAIHQILPPGSSLTQSIEVSAKIQKLLLDNFPEIEHIVTKIGTAEVPTDPMPMEVGDIIVKMKPKSEWRHQTKEEMYDAMREVLSALPGVLYEFTQPIQMRFNELISGVREDIAIKIYGDDLSVLAQKGNEVNSIIQSTKGIGDIKVEQVEGLPQIVINYNRENLSKYDISISTVNQAIETAFAGGVAGVVFEGERRFDLVVRLDESHRKSIKNVEELLISTPEGTQIPLKELADISYQNAPMQISHENSKRRITVGVNAKTNDIEGLVNNIEQQLNAKLNLPPGYFIEYGGQFENLEKAKNRLYIAVPVALLLILILLYFAFGSIIQSLIIFMAIPLSAIGGIYALVLRDMPFSISAGIGFIALFGVAVLNGIVLIGYFNQLKKEGMSNTYDIIMKGAKTRLRPVVMTASVAILGFLPMAISQSAGAEVQKPLATVVIGGLITATFLTLFILPILYSWIGHLKPNKIPSNTTKLLILSLGLSTISTSYLAQNTPILSLEETIKKAIELHPEIKIADYSVKKAKAEGKALRGLDKTSLDFSHGQINSDYRRDYQINLNQSFKFPSYYKNSKQLYSEIIRSKETEKNISINSISYQAKTRYLELLNIKDKISLTQELLDYQNTFYHMADKKMKSGEGDMIEAQTLLVEKLQMETSLQNLQNNYKIKLSQLQNFIGYNSNFDIKHTPFYKLTFEYDTSFISNSPYVLLQKQNIAMSDKQLKTTRSENLPEWSIGYFNQSIDGTINLQGLNLGLQIPLFFSTQKNAYKANALELKIQEEEFYNTQRTITQRFYELVAQITALQNQISLYETQIQPLTQNLINLYQKAFKEGDKEYIHYLHSLTEYNTLRINYIDNLGLYNQLIAELELLLGKN